MIFIKYFLLAFLLSNIFLLIAIYIFPKIGLLDFPEKYGLKRKKLPYPGGIIFWLLSFFIILIDYKFFNLFFALLLLGAVSFFDDRKQISAIMRFFIHFVIATFIFFQVTKIDFIGNPFSSFCTNCQENFYLANYSIISFLFTIFWIVLLQNALNFFDGIRGLTVGVSGVGFLTLGILGIAKPELYFDPNHTSTTIANFYLAGLCTGGFFYFWKNKIILGDTGSQILGFLLAILSIFSGAKIATTLLVLSLPILDAGVVIFRRIFLDKKSPFQGDLKHLHHNLSKKLGEKNTALLLIFLSSMLGGIAVFFQSFQKMIALIFALMAILILDIWAGYFKK